MFKIFFEFLSHISNQIKSSRHIVPVLPNNYFDFMGSKLESPLVLSNSIEEPNLVLVYVVRPLAIQLHSHRRNGTSHIFHVLFKSNLHLPKFQTVDPRSKFYCYCIDVPSPPNNSKKNTTLVYANIHRISLYMRDFSSPIS